MSNGYSIFDLFKDIADETKQFKDEMQEILTDGFKETVIKGNSNYKTSYEKIDEADSIKNSAKERLDRRQVEVQNYYDETNHKLDNHFSYKQYIMDHYIKKSQRVIKEYLNFNIDSRIIDKDIIQGMQNYSASFNTVKIDSALAEMCNSFRSTFNLSYGSLSSIFAQKSRVESANKYLEEAQEYKERINAQIAQLDFIKEKLRLIQKMIDEEVYLLNKFLLKLDELIKNIEGCMEKKRFTREEADRVESIYEITKTLEEILVVKFFDSNGDITMQYKNKMNETKEMLTNMNL